MSTNQLLDRAATAKALAAPPYLVEAEPARPQEQAARGGLLVATDGTDGADAAVVLGRALAERDGLEAELVTVFEPAAALGVPAAADVAVRPAVSLPVAEFSEKRALWERIQEQRHRIAPGAVRWPVTFEVGNRAQAITRVARDKGHRLIVTGLGAHGAKARCLGRETALRVIRRARVPVLAVAPHASGVPRSALVAVDFSPSSVNAARAALDLLGESGVVYLAHVMPRARATASQTAWQRSYETSVRTLFDMLRRALPVRPDIAIARVVLHGDPAAALLTFAEERAVDLVAAGSHGYSAIRRTLVGSVSTELVRGVRCSVLVAPPTEW